MKIYLIASTQRASGIDEFLVDRGLEWFLEQPGTEPELVAEFAGRICYLSFGPRQRRRTTRTYLKNIITAKHESVLEHANFTLLADDISRALSHQLIRHRAGFAYSQLSQQYHDESAAIFVEPEGLDEEPALRARWEQWRAATLALYADLQTSATFSPEAAHGLSSKEASRRRRSQARLVLPNATATSLVVTGNARAWRHVLLTRGAIAGDKEMRDYCVEVWRALSRAAPNLFDDFALVDDELGPYVRFVQA